MEQSLDEGHHWLNIHSGPCKSSNIPVPLKLLGKSSNCDFLYFDMYSLLYELKLINFHVFVNNSELRYHFDFPIYPKIINSLAHKTNWSTLKFKDVWGRSNWSFHRTETQIPKLNQVSTSDKQRQSASGASKHAQQQLTHILHRKKLQTDESFRATNIIFGSQWNELRTLSAENL